MMMHRQMKKQHRLSEFSHFFNGRIKLRIYHRCPFLIENYEGDHLFSPEGEAAQGVSPLDPPFLHTVYILPFINSSSIS
jgi:hypothetical protein